MTLVEHFEDWRGTKTFDCAPDGAPLRMTDAAIANQEQRAQIAHLLIGLGDLDYVVDCNQDDYNRGADDSGRKHEFQEIDSESQHRSPEEPLYCQDIVFRIKEA